MTWEMWLFLFGMVWFALGFLGVAFTFKPKKFLEYILFSILCTGLISGWGTCVYWFDLHTAKQKTESILQQVHP